jgi:hypothetical protein
MSYKISQYTINRAKELGVEVRPSKNKGKKIDVIKDGKKIASIGDIRYSDYASTQDKERRRLYRIRHKGEDKKINSPGFWSWNLLW